MLDLLSDYLNISTSAEEKNHIAVADRALVRAQLEYEHVIEEILALDDDADSGVTLQLIVAVYRTQLFHLLELHSVTVSADLGIKTLADLVNGLLDLDNYENPQELFALAEDDAPVIEKFCMVLAQVTQYDVEHLMQMVEDVSETFLQRLKTVNQSDTYEDENELIERRERIHAYRKYEIYLQAANLVTTAIPAILRSGVSPSMPYDIYVKLIDNHSPIEAMPAKTIARELFGAAIISCDGFGSPGETVKAGLEEYLASPQTIGLVMVEVRQLMMGYAQ